MSRTQSTSRPSETGTGTVRSRDLTLTGVAVFALVVVIGVLVAAGNRTVEPAASTVGEYEASGSVEAAGLAVDGATIDLGTVPLDVTVTPTWTITNVTGSQIILGEPHASVLEGCCPGPLALAETVLEPGESTTLRFPLQMHVGMDGPHDFDVHVPVAATAEYLTLKVVGTFAG
ncbi:MAG TPA: hypothetical protein VMS74_06980 [Acidimicrobiia bacterium]|nr:hypothetical protein [Acidimicrobiia bacterium]